MPRLKILLKILSAQDIIMILETKKIDNIIHYYGRILSITYDFHNIIS